MTMMVYIVRDKLAQSDSPVFESANDLTAKKATLRMLEQAGEIKNLSDYQLLNVGSHLHDVGTLKIYPEPYEIDLEVKNDGK